MRVLPCVRAAQGAGVAHHEEPGKDGHRRHHGHAGAEHVDGTAIKLSISDFKFMMISSAERTNAGGVGRASSTAAAAGGCKGDGGGDGGGAAPAAASDKGCRTTRIFGRLDKLVGMINTHIDDIGHHATAKGKGKGK